ncbi:MAG: four helix bundle protein [Bacteroidales bacterium]
MKSFRQLDVWKTSKELANLIYTITKSFPKTELFGLTSQMRRASVSIPSNIAEGIGRGGYNERIRFLCVARGSLFELITQLEIALDQQFVCVDDFDKIYELTDQCGMLINGSIRYCKNRVQ